ncbi:MAG: hypothetical protein KF746_28350 [Chitinophagaceae bacterium]|nr:hypothetical protein [Chitinophagaceae bacterium]
MKQLSFLVLAFLCIQSASAQNDIYSTRSQTLSEKSLDLADFKGKNILFVCLDSNDSPLAQLVEYRQLASHFRDSGFAIIVCMIEGKADDSSLPRYEWQSPSGKVSFKDGFSPDWVTIIQQPAKGNEPGTLYDWLASERKNGIVNEPLVHNGRKYLVSREGKITGIFSRSIRPMDPEIISAIENNK